MKTVRSTSCAALLVLGCGTNHSCPDPEKAVGTWSPIGGTPDHIDAVAANSVEFFVLDCSRVLEGGCQLVVQNVEKESQERSSSVPSPELVERTVGLGASEDAVLAVSGQLTQPRSYFNGARLWNQEDDTWTEVGLPEYLPSAEGYSVHWTGDRFVVFGGITKDLDYLGIGERDPDQHLAAGAFFDPMNLEWSPLNGDGPTRSGETVWTNKGLFYWAWAQDVGTSGAWLYDEEQARWREVSVEGAPRPQSQTLTTDGRTVWMSGRWLSDQQAWEKRVWSFDVRDERWEEFQFPPEVMPSSGGFWVGDRLLFFTACEAGSMYFPESDSWGVVSMEGEPTHALTRMPVGRSLVVYGHWGHHAEIPSGPIYKLSFDE